MDGGDAEGRPGLDCLTRHPLTRGGRGGAFTAFWALPHLPLKFRLILKNPS
jgi:hypothetical protein